MFQALGVQHGNVPAQITDQTGGLQLESRFCHALAAHAEHVGDQFMRHHELVALQAVEAHQQPATELPVQGVEPVAHRRLRHLCDQRLGVAQQKAHQRAGSGELRLYHRRRQHKTTARAKHHGAAGRRPAAHEQRNADHALVAYDGDFGRRTVLHLVDQRDDRSDRKIDLRQCAPRFVERLAQWHVDRFKVRQQALPLILRQGCEQAVFAEVRGDDHETP